MLEFPRAMPKGARRAAPRHRHHHDGATRSDPERRPRRHRQSHHRGRPRGAVSRSRPARARLTSAGKYIVPGFVDTHAHWEFRTHDVLEPQNWSLSPTSPTASPPASTYRPPPTTTSPTRTWSTPAQIARPARLHDRSRHLLRQRLPVVRGDARVPGALQGALPDAATSSRTWSATASSGNGW